MSAARGAEPGGGPSRAALTTAAAAGAAAGVAAAALAAEGAGYAAKRRAIAALRDRCREQRTLVLTYDDGPGPTLTPRLLALLAEHDAHATFFPLGRRALVAPDVLDAVAAGGHEVGTHSLVHRNAWRTSPWATLRDVDGGYAALAPWVPADGTFRPPHGKLTLPVRAALRRRGAAIAWWTRDSGDTHAALPDPDAVAAAVVRDGGGVVLLHDHDEDRPEERLDFVLATTRHLLRTAHAQGLAVRPLVALA